MFKYMSNQVLPPPSKKNKGNCWANRSFYFLTGLGKHITKQLILSFATHWFTLLSLSWRKLSSQRITYSTRNAAHKEGRTSNTRPRVQYQLFSKRKNTVLLQPAKGFFSRHFLHRIFQVQYLRLLHIHFFHILQELERDEMFWIQAYESKWTNTEICVWRWVWKCLIRWNTDENEETHSLILK